MEWYSDSDRPHWEGLLHSRSSVGSSELFALSGDCSQQSWLFERWSVVGYWWVHHRWDRVVRRRVWKPCSSAALNITVQEIFQMFSTGRLGGSVRLGLISWNFYRPRKKGRRWVLTRDRRTTKLEKVSLGDDTFRDGPVPRQVEKA